MSLLDFKHLVQESALEASSYQVALMVGGERPAFLEAAQGKDMTWNTGNDVKIFGKFRMHQRLQNHVRKAQKHMVDEDKVRLGVQRPHAPIPASLAIRKCTCLVVCSSRTKSWIVIWSAG